MGMFWACFYFRAKKPPIVAVRNLTQWGAVKPYAWEMYGCGSDLFQLVLFPTLEP